MTPAAPFPLYVGDCEPAAEWVIVDEADEPVDTTGWVVERVVLRRDGDGLVVVGAGAATFNEERTTGILVYEWDPADTAAEGTYTLTARVDTTGAGRFLTFEWERPVMIRPFPS